MKALRWHPQDSIKVVKPTTTLTVCQHFSFFSKKKKWAGCSFTAGPPAAAPIISLRFSQGRKKKEKKKGQESVLMFRNDVPSARRRGGLREGCELPLVDETQHCIVTWILFFFIIFFYSRSIRHEDGTFSPRYRGRSSMFEAAEGGAMATSRVCACIKYTKKRERAAISVSLALCDMT